MRSSEACSHPAEQFAGAVLAWRPMLLKFSPETLQVGAAKREVGARTAASAWPTGGSRQPPEEAKHARWMVR